MPRRQTCAESSEADLVWVGCGGLSIQRVMGPGETTWGRGAEMQVGSWNGVAAWQEKTGTRASHPEHKSHCKKAENTHRGPLPDPQHRLLKPSGFPKC